MTDFPSEIPGQEIDVLTMTAIEAADLAESGELAAGYTALLGGVQRAQELADEGEPWGRLLVTRWRLACDNYCREYGVREVE